MGWGLTLWPGAEIVHRRATVCVCLCVSLYIYIYIYIYMYCYTHHLLLLLPPEGDIGRRGAHWGEGAGDEWQ